MSCYSQCQPLTNVPGYTSRKAEMGLFCELAYCCIQKFVIVYVLYAYVCMRICIFGSLLRSVVEVEGAAPTPVYVGPRTAVCKVVECIWL